MKQREISEERRQIDALDGLRGFAALIVVFSHTSNSGLFFLPFLDLQGIGKSGVFLFFLLSAFLLSVPLIEKGKNAFSFNSMSHYWQRRFFRIYPLYTLYLLLAVASSFVFSHFLNKQSQGIPFYLDWWGFFKHMALQDGKGVTWSIAVEFKFYFILPFICLLVSYLYNLRFSFTIISLLAMLIISQYVFPQSKSLTNDPRLLPYLPIFLFGIALAAIQVKLNNTSKNHLNGSVVNVLGLLGVLGITIMAPSVYELFFHQIERNHFHNQFILYSLFWSLILFAAVNVNGIIKKFFCFSLFRFYGALSFSIYLFHPIFIFLVKRLDLNAFLSAWLVLLLSTLASYISFRFLEYPVSKFKLIK